MRKRSEIQKIVALQENFQVLLAALNEKLTLLEAALLEKIEPEDFAQYSQYQRTIAALKLVLENTIPQSLAYYDIIESRHDNSDKRERKRRNKGEGKSSDTDSHKVATTVQEIIAQLNLTAADIKDIDFEINGKELSTWLKIPLDLTSRKTPLKEEPTKQIPCLAQDRQIYEEMIALETTLLSELIPALQPLDFENIITAMAQDNYIKALVCKKYPSHGQALCQLIGLRALKK